jgi:exopolysaccharide production protein ExoQ
MSKASTHSFELGRARSSTSMIDKFVIAPILACAYVEIISPLLLYAGTGPIAGLVTEAQRQIMMAPRLEHKIFWPALAAISLILTVRNWSRLTLPPHIMCLFAYLAFAGASISWAFKPEISFVRFVQQAMIVTSIVLPTLLAARTANMMRGLFLCFAFALIVNVAFVLDQTPIIIENVSIGYPGYFSFKGLLGECSAIALLLSLHEMLYPGWRRAFGIIAIGIAICLLVLSDSKGSLGLALLAPLLARLTLFIGKKMRVSPAIVLLPIPICYAILSSIVGNLINRISWHLYDNYTLSGRTFIWDFTNFEIARNPLLGWGYQSFWLVGPDAPSLVDAPGWIKTMPSSHNGYLDTMLDTGYVGLALLVIFLFATLHAIGRVADREPARAWLLLTLALFVILTNFLETTWMHGMDMLWLMFVIVAAETGRYWQPFPARASEPMCRGPVIAGRRPALARAQGSDKLGRI